MSTPRTSATSLSARLSSPLLPIIWTAIAMAVVMLLSRIGLMTWQRDHVAAAQGIAPVLLGGLRADLAWLGLALGLPAVLVTLLPPRRQWAQRALRCWLVAQLAWVVFLEAATPDFMQEYGLRPNRIFLEYLIYPREVGATLLRGHLLSSVLGVALVVIAAVSMWRWLRRRTAAAPSAPWLLRIPAAVVVLLLSAFAVRSTLGHRPLNPALLAFSTNATVNQLPLNSAFALAHAARDWQSEQKDVAKPAYGSLPWSDMVHELRAETGLPASAFMSSALPTLAKRQPHYTGKPRNLVIILEESLGAQFVGHLGGLPLTPELDALSEEGWRFDRLYATGTRSVRGIEAVVTGFTPTPAQAVVKLSRSQQGLFSLAEVLQAHGYDATFYYGGESHFDNMRSFFLGNGFTRVIDQKDYVKPAFVGSWGVSDEDLMRKAHGEFTRLHAANKPFFGLVFSSSNHDPFEFPDGRIQLHDATKATRNNAAKYADYAIGEFFRLAKASPYWQDTVFLVVADHDSRVLGQSLVPIANFHIPGVLLGAGITPRRDARIVSQIDLPVTLLSLIGIGDATPMLGHDLTGDTLPAPGRALMQYDRNLAWMQGDRVAILQPEKPAQGFRYDHATRRMTPADVDPAIVKRATAISQWGTEAYRRGLHTRHLPPNDAPPTH